MTPRQCPGVSLLTRSWSDSGQEWPSHALLGDTPFLALFSYLENGSKAENSKLLIMAWSFW